MHAGSVWLALGLLAATGAQAQAEAQLAPCLDRACPAQERAESCGRLAREPSLGPPALRAGRQAGRG